jgi:DAK2 domain fusion protein YloV
MYTDKDITIATQDLESAFTVAEKWLATNKESINSINVYPVPDGDTGTNMLLTLKAAIKEVQKNKYHSASEFTEKLAYGALLGARGNSGVILSQMLKGFSESFEQHKDITAETMALGLESAAKKAYSSLAHPAEGTMLSVLRDAAKSAVDKIKSSSSITDTLKASIDKAEESVEKTKEQLPELIEAGVVDAGAIGVLIILEGLYFGLLEITPPDLPKFEVAYLNFEHSEDDFGFCTEFLIKHAQFNKNEIEQKLELVQGQSIIVVGDENIMHIHVHMEIPDNAIALGKEIGEVENIKIENMQEQHEKLKNKGKIDKQFEPQKIGAIAVLQGDGFKEIYNELGITHFIDGGQGANPAAGDILSLSKKIAKESCIILTNNKNIIAAAKQASELSDGFIEVISSTSPAIGIVAALEYDPEGDLSDIVDGMNDAVNSSRSLEITTAMKKTTIDQQDVKAGEYIAMIDGQLVATHHNLKKIISEALNSIGEVDLVTLYSGDMINNEEAKAISHHLEENYKDIDIELHNGGQPLYHILGSIE